MKTSPYVYLIVTSMVINFLLLGAISTVSCREPVVVHDLGHIPSVQVTAPKVASTYDDPHFTYMVQVDVAVKDLRWTHQLHETRLNKQLERIEALERAQSPCGKKP